MESFLRTSANARSVEADLCRACNGVWYDGAEVTAAHPALGELPWHRLDLFRTSTRPDANCPRGHGIMAEVPFIEIALDVCFECHGVFVDGGEHAALANAMATRETSEPVLDGAYRSATANALFRGVIACKRCRAEVPTSETMMTSEGLMCAPCAETFERSQDGASDDANDGVSRDAGAWKFMRETGAAVGSLLGALIAANRPCPLCGRARGTCMH